MLRRRSTRPEAPGPAGCARRCAMPPGRSRIASSGEPRDRLPRRGRGAQVAVRAASPGRSSRLVWPIQDGLERSGSAAGSASSARGSLAGVARRCCRRRRSSSSGGTTRPSSPGALRRSPLPPVLRPKQAAARQADRPDPARRRPASTPAQQAAGVGASKASARKRLQRATAAASTKPKPGQPNSPGLPRSADAAAARHRRRDLSTRAPPPPSSPPAPAPKSPGPAAIAVARAKFAGAFVLYETGGDDRQGPPGFRQTATPAAGPGAAAAPAAAAGQRQGAEGEGPQHRRRALARRHLHAQRLAAAGRRDQRAAARQWKAPPARAGASPTSRLSR